MVLDKENAGGLFHSGKLNSASSGVGGGVTKTVLSNVKCSQQLSTPKLTSQPGVFSKQRRALGDVFNTTSSKHVNATPITQKCLNLINTPSSNVKSGPNGKKQPTSQVKTSLKMENLNVHDAMPPVEQCHVYMDTFEDLFENGNAVSSFKHETSKETYHLFEKVNNENEWQKNMKNINKLLRKERKTAFNNVIMEMEMPELEAPKLLLVD